MSAVHSSERQIELDAVVRTALLQHRPRRRPDYEAQNRALVSLSQVLANPPRDILQHLVDAAMELCQGGSAGISIIEEHMGEKVFRWHALSGALASHRWGTTPRDFSPCGTVIDRNAVQLMHLPERHFLYFANVKPQIVEALLVPFSVRGQPVGTIWVVTHDDRRKFDAEDERLVKELGHFASEAYQLASSVETSKITDRRKDEFLAMIAHEMRSPLSTMPSAIRHIRDRATKADISDPLSGAPHRAAPRSGSGPLPRGTVHHGQDHNGKSSAPATGAPDSHTVSLLRRMRGGDQDAFEQLYDCTVGSVRALAKAILKSAEDAEEVVCDTFAQAWRQSERFDSERASPIGWLMMMCRSRAIDRLRHNRSRASSRTVALESVCELASDGLRPEELLSLFHDGARVQGALKALSPQRLKLVGLAFFEGLTFLEMAERTGMPLGTVKSHIRRALVELRRNLQSTIPG
jgi:RNA polymerase sigma factor (sigma-70 family)